MDYQKSNLVEITQDICERLKGLSASLLVESQKNNSLELLSKECMDIAVSADMYILRYFKKLGKTKSAAKSKAAKENGTKYGGRPPKEIQEARRRIKELSLKNVDWTSEDKQEYKELTQKVDQWEISKYGELRSYWSR